MGCTVAVPREGEEGVHRGRNASNRKPPRHTRNSPEETAALDSGLSNDSVMEDSANGLEGKISGANVIGENRPRQVSYSRSNEEVCKDTSLEEPYLTEDMMMDLSERSQRSSGTKDEVLLMWIAQIPPELPEIDTLVIHDNLITEVNALNELKDKKVRKHHKGKSA